MHENPLVVETFMFGVSLAVKVGFECLLRSMAVLQVRHDKVSHNRSPTRRLFVLKIVIRNEKPLDWSHGFASCSLVVETR